MSRLSGGFELSLQLDNVDDGLWDRRRFEFFFDSRVLGMKELSDLVSDSDDEREASFEKQNNGSHLCEDIGSRAFEDSGFV